MTPVLVPAACPVCEHGDWERHPGNGGTITCCAHCGHIAAITDDNPEEPGLHRVTLVLCSLCMAGTGGQCHSPGCALWLNRAPDLALTVPTLADEAARLAGDS